MDKLTLQHLAPYLPYGLHIETPFGIKAMKGIDTAIDEAFCVIYWNEGKRMLSWSLNCKPILRPLSDLTKEIEHKGERFVPIDYLSGRFGDAVGEWAYLYTHNQAEIDDIPYKAIKKMHEWHIDTFGLIAAGLAVDMNTLEGGSNNG